MGIEKALKKHGNDQLTGIPPVTVEILYQLGLAVEGGCDEEQMRESYGDATVNWLQQAEKSPEWTKFWAKAQEVGEA